MVSGSIALVIGLAVVVVIAMSRRRSPEQKIDHLVPLGTWTVTSIGLAAEEKRRHEGPLVMLHGRDIRRMLHNWNVVRGLAHQYRAKARDWPQSDEAEELKLMIAKLTQNLRTAFGFLLLSPLEYVIRRISQSESYFCSTAAALAYENVFLMLEGIAEIVDVRAAEKIGRHLS
jgi:hypothetical protein